ncbi:two-component system sensor histidine kinase NtrB [Desulfolithobacter sp.]
MSGQQAKLMKFFTRPRLLYVSPWLLAAATGLLVLIVVTFALSNIRREKQLMTTSMLQKAATLMRVLHSGSRAAYLSDLRRGGWLTDSWEVYVQRVIDHVAEDPDIRFLGVVDEHGRVIAWNEKNIIGSTISFVRPPAPTKQSENQSSLVFEIVGMGEERIFEAVRPFIPYRPVIPPSPFMSPGGQQHQGQAFSPDSNRYYVVVGLDMRDYDQTLRRLRFQILMMSLAMLMVGTGGWLSLAAVQGYRVSQRTLQEIQAFTGLLIARLPVGIIATDRKGRISTWNQSAAAMIGRDEADTKNRRPDEVLPRELASFFCREVRDGHCASQVRQDGEIRLRINDKEVVLFCSRIMIFDNENRYTGQVLLLTDLTMLKMLEQEMRENERLAAVGRMAAGVAHEVRNPLSSVKGLALLLKGKFREGSREKETADLLIREVERMNRTISELLSFARPMPPQTRPVNLQELLAKIMRLMEHDISSSGIEATCEMAEDLKTVAGDPDRLQQVFVNIFLNAVQAMPDGGTLSVRAETGDDGTTVLVTVRDTGCGMDSATLQQVFYPYFTTKDQGTGIGLAISQKIIADHGGTIQIRSAPGQGTEVIVELPVFLS